MVKIYKQMKPLILVASAAWVLGFFGMIGAHQGAKLTGVVLVIAYQESPSEEKSDDE